LRPNTIATRPSGDVGIVVGVEGDVGHLAEAAWLGASLRVEVNPVNVRDAGKIERAVKAFALSPNGGLIATTVPGVALHRDLIITLAARHKLPTVYYARFYVAAGGLISYGPDYVDQYRQAAGYVDRILKGENRPTCRCRRPPSTKW
jgi:putative ABC transport system substrate-binding protein